MPCREESGGPSDDPRGGDAIGSLPQIDLRPGSNSNGNLAYALNAKPGYRDGDADTNYVVAAPLSHGSNPNSNMAGRRREDDVNLVATAFHMTQDPISGDISPAMGKGNKQGTATITVNEGVSVRRLTPTECERLQSLPDGWTRVPDDAPDSRRYAALGDAVTANVAQWIGERILASERQVHPTAAPAAERRRSR